MTEVVDAFEAACAAVKVALVDFVMTIDGETLPPRYLLLLERAPGAGDSDGDLLRLLAAFDRELRARTLYGFARKSGALLPMAALALERDSFESFQQQRARQGGASPQQLKIAHVVSDPSFASRHFSHYRRLALPDDHLAPTALY